MVSPMAPVHSDEWWNGPVTFVPSSPPRRSVLARWRPDAAVGLFADDVGGPTIDVVVPRGDAPRRETMAVDERRLDAVLGELLSLDPSAVSPSARWWARAAESALDLVARGHLVPAVMADGTDAWQVDPLEPADHAALDALVAACPPEAHAQIGRAHV